MSLRKIEMPCSQRRTINLRLRPWIQLRLPIVVLAITLVFGALFAVNGQQAYGRLLEMGLDQPWIKETIARQSRDFLIVSSVLGVGYVLAVLVACLAYGHRVLGPLAPIRRQIEGMKNGDYVTTLSLREGDLFNEVAEDLNELAGILRSEQKLTR